MFLRSRGLAALTSSPRRSSASALSGSANRGDFSRIMQLEVVDSHNASPLTCCLLLRLFRFGFDLFFWLKFVCRRVSLDYLASAAALILFDQESPSPLTSLNNCV